MGLVMMLGISAYSNDRRRRRPRVAQAHRRDLRRDRRRRGVVFLALMAWMPDATGLLVVSCASFRDSRRRGRLLPSGYHRRNADAGSRRPARRREFAPGRVTSRLIGQALRRRVSLLGAPLLFLSTDLYAFASVSTSLANIPRPCVADAPRPSVRDQLRAGLVFVREQRGLGSLVLVSTIANFFAAPFVVVLPFFVEDTLGVSSDWFGYLIASLGAGGLVGYALAGTTSRARGAPTLLACLLGMSVCIGALAWATTRFGPPCSSCRGTFRRGVQRRRRHVDAGADAGCVSRACVRSRANARDGGHARGHGGRWSRHRRCRPRRAIAALCLRRDSSS
jgi:hypothetical protein